MNTQEDQPIWIDGNLAGSIYYSKKFGEWVAFPSWSDRKPIGFAEDREGAVFLVKRYWHRRHRSSTPADH